MPNALLLAVALAMPGAIDLTDPKGPVAPGQAVFLPVLGPTQAELIGSDMITHPEATALLLFDVSGRGMVVFQAMRPGQYLVWLGYVEGNRIVSDRTTVTVQGTGPQPVPPTPGPGPTPPTPPTPGPVEAAQAVIVEEASERPPWAAQVLSSVAARHIVENRFYVLDQHSQNLSEAKQSWVEQAKGRPLPYLFIGGPDGTAAWHGPLPETVAGLISVLQKHVKQRATFSRTTPTVSYRTSQPARVLSPQWQGSQWDQPACTGPECCP